MIKHKNIFNLFCCCFFSIYFTACKGPKGTTTTNTTTTETSSPVDQLSQIAPISANTTEVDEGKSGMEEELPLDASIRTGKLANGLRYYIKQNSKPEQRIELRLAVNAGSNLEEDNQRGLAHFLEHMAFNGTKKFEKNELVDFLESTGVRFGADLNAYTSFDETVYMLQLPTDKTGLVDKGLTVMSEWAGNLSLEGSEIDKERGVIESEWRTRLGAERRMRQVWFPILFNNSRYANRLPIGTMDVIKNSPYERIRTFYKDWYRPNLMALVVVGDVNLDAMEQKIKDNFSALENPKNEKPRQAFEVKDHEETFVSIVSDKEATATNVTVFYKHPATQVTNMEEFRTDLMIQLYNSMIGERLAEISQKKNSPLISAAAGFGSFIRTKSIYSAMATAKEGGVLKSLDILLQENQRVLQHGFTESELERQKLSIINGVERQEKEQDKISSANWANACVANFLTQNPLMSPSDELKLTKELLKSITLKELNALAPKWIRDENRMVLITAPEKEGLTLPTEERVRELLAGEKSMVVEPYKDKFLDLPLLSKELKETQIKKEQVINKDLELTEIVLANGIRVLLKPTDFQNDQILLRAYSPGGHSLYSDEDFFTASNAAAIVNESGVGAFDQIALSKKLTGKTLRLSPYIGELEEGFSGSSSIKDFETLLKLNYLYATDIREDKEAFDRYITQSKEQIRNIASNPMYYFYDQMVKAQSGNHPRRKVLYTEKDYDGVNMQRALEIYRDRFADFSDFTYVIVGNFEVDKIRPLLAKYLGNLPTIQRKENWKDVQVNTPQNGVEKHVKKGMAPQANVYMGFITEQEWSLERAQEVAAIGAVLNIMVRENLREDKGGVYSPYVGAQMSKLPKGQSAVTVIFQCGPKDVDKLVAAVKEEVASFLKNGPSIENFQKVTETQRRTFETNIKKNKFWLGTLQAYDNYQVDFNKILEKKERINNLSAEKMLKTAKAILQLDKAIIVTVKPEKEEVEDKE